MAKYVKQVRYYGDNSSKNQPANLRAQDMLRGYAFQESQSSPGANIVQLGIQTMPGVKFTINTSPQPIVVGSTGIYELNVDGLTMINKLTFDNASLSKINDNTNGYIIVDYIYEKEEA